MPYIGKATSVQNIIKLDSITASATASYTMQRTELIILRKI